MSATYPAPLIFGIYPGGHTGIEELGVVPDDPLRIQEALNRLQVDDQPFLVRAYLPYRGSLTAVNAGLVETPKAAEQYLRKGRALDLVLTYRQPDLAGWPEFIRSAIRHYGAQLATLQITEEANVTTVAAVDGCIPQVREALVGGVIAAKAEIQRCGLDVQVGFTTAPSIDPADDFWPAIGALGGRPFLDALDYVGFDFFPDVFRPLADASEARLCAAVVGVLAHFRSVSLAAAHIPPTCPIHISENGWSTGPARPVERQAEVVEQVIRTIYSHREQFNITHYEHFALRDANSANPDLNAQFGLLRDDYQPKPAFERYQRLIAELGRALPAQ